MVIRIIEVIIMIIIITTMITIARVAAASARARPPRPPCGGSAPGRRRPGPSAPVCLEFPVVADLPRLA